VTGDRADPFLSSVATYWKFMKNWIEKYGTPEMRRALAEGYEISNGSIADVILSEIGQSLELPICHEWEKSEERKDPSSTSFARRDVVVQCVRSIGAPPDWHIDVSRILRVEETSNPRKFWTGVSVQVLRESKVIKEMAVNLEGMR
jgi:hypothetical protein